MIRDTIWLVTAHSGRYADYTTWPVRAVVLEHVARKLAADLTELSKKSRDNIDLLRELDPKFSEDLLYGPTEYTAEEIPHDECDGINDAIVKMLELKGEVLTRSVSELFEITFSEARTRLHRLADEGRAHQIMLGWRPGPLPESEPRP